MNEEPKKVKEGPAHTFGWLRRSELDHPKNYDVWETPDGTLYGYSRKGVEPYIIGDRVADVVSTKTVKLPRK